ncbi:MAG: hypothetical protein FD146_395 [Anaerolineaceae bacterium]|nr:MAG: hypothetical protein FD146_395 [Anaerolineaceae bacterium]
MKTKLFFLLSILAIGALLTACGPSTVNVQPQPTMRTITVTGTGMVTLTPDIAYVSIGVHSQEESAAAALDDNSAKAAAVIAAVKGFGVEDRDIQTTNFSIYPQPVYDADYNQIGVTYAVDNTVYVTVRDLEILGGLLDASVRAGANTIGSISFDVADKSDALTQARLAAVAEARKQADELVSAAGVRLGDVQTISYYDYTPSPVYYDTRAMSANAAPSVPVEAGSMQITTTVTIVYELK